VGRKAASLSHLIEAGFPVPLSVCVTTEALNAALSDGTDLRLPDGLLDALIQALPVGVPLAVRSSATMEDLPETSMAGRFATCLNVSGPVALEQAILECWQSYLSIPDAKEDGGMAVLIQPLLDSECAGVCFTAEPVQLRPDLLLVISAWGLGTGVVDGSIPTDIARLRRTDLGVENFSVADKHTAIRSFPGKGGVTPVPVPGELRQVPCLPESWLQRVGQFGLTIEQVLGAPQDVEWAVAGGLLWILQSRPITALPEEIRQTTGFPLSWANETEPRHFWWLVPSTDHPGAVLYPAEIDFIRTSYQGGQDAVYFGGSSDTRWIKFANGRQYMTRAKSGLAPGKMRVNTAARQDLLERMARENTTAWDFWGPEIELATARLAAFDASEAESPALANHLENVLATSIRHWMVQTLTPRPSRSAALLEVYKQLTGMRSEEAEKDIPILLAGTETIQTRLVEALFDLTCLALEDLETARSIVFRQIGGLQAKPDIKAFARGFDHLVSIYGDRLCYRAVPGYPVDLPFTWRESPEHMWGMIETYLPLARQGAQADPRKAREASQRAMAERLEKLCAASDPDLVERFHLTLAYARRNAAFLDEHNHYIDQLSGGQYVQALFYAGRWLARHGKLEHELDVFWLYSEEIIAGLNETIVNLDDIITRRRMEFAAWQVFITPACLGLPDPKLGDRPEQPPQAPAGEAFSAEGWLNVLHGEPASRGRAVGRARIVADSTAMPEITPGDVLVAAYVWTPWTPILPILAGVVLDFGSPGDHPAITAREFGIPVVCSTLYATRRIPEGVVVTIDADAGLVTWSESES
jgi:rifampicin phosphotransferase